MQVGPKGRPDEATYTERAIPPRPQEGDGEDPSRALQEVEIY